MRRSRNIFRIGLWLAPLVSLFIACEPFSDSPSTGLGEVRYVLDWTSESKALVQDDGSLKITTDMGFDVVVEEAYFVSSRAEVVSCATNEAESAGVISTLKGWATRLFGISEAYAGHSSMPDNLTATEHSRVENLLDMEEQLLGVRDLDDAPYCQAHYLTARASNSSEGLPEGFDMTDRSLYVRGYALALESGESIDFEGSTDLSNGVLSTLALEDEETFVHQGLDGNLEVLIVRDLTHLLDGIDFSTASSAAIGWRALDNLMLNLEIVGVPSL